MKFLTVLFLLINFCFANNINIKANQWNLVGTTSDINVSDFSLNSDDIIWHYSDNNWSCYLEGGNCGYSTLSNLKSGDAFWIRSSNDINLSLDDGSVEKNISNGWNMITAVTNDINMSSYATDNNISFAFTYDKYWKAYSKSGIMSNLGYSSLDTIKKNQGAWVYKYNYQTIEVGDENTSLINGNFGTVYKSITDDEEDIWNVKFKNR